MGYANYIGRVGALAVALGVGMAVATTPGVAWAVPDGNTLGDSNTPKKSTDTTGNTKNTDVGSSVSTPPSATVSGTTGTQSVTPSTTGATAISKSPTETTLTDTTGPAVTVRSSGGALTSGTDITAPDLVPPATTPSQLGNANDEPVTTTSPTASSEQPQSPAALLPKTTPLQGSSSRPAITPRTKTDSVPASAAFAAPQASIPGGDTTMRLSAVDPNPIGARDISPSIATFAALDAPAPPPAAPADPISALLTIPVTFINTAITAATSFVTGVLNAVLIPAPGAPPDSPLLWAVLAAVRRQFTTTLTNSTPTLDPQETSQDIDDRQIHGDLNSADPDGDTLTFTVPDTGVGAPAHGDVTIDAVNRTWTYTPDADYGGGPDSFSITASDEASGFHLHAAGQMHTVTKTVNVTVAPLDTNQPPVVTDPTPPNHPDPDTGEVTGSLGVSDPDGDPLTITFVEGSEPKYGTVTFDDVTGTYVYTPTQAGQLRAALGLGDTDSFSVIVTQGEQQAAPFSGFTAFAALADTGDGFEQPVTVTDIPIAPADLHVNTDAIAAGDRPSGIFVTDTYADVVNSGDGTVTVIDLSDYSTVGDPLTMGTQPVFAARSGDRLYVLNSGDGTISVIDTVGNTVVGDPIDVGVATSVVASPDGTRLYVGSIDTGTFSSYVKVVDIAAGSPTENTVVQQIAVGGLAGNDLNYANGAMAFSADGSRLYVGRVHNGDITSPTPTLDGNVVVIDTDSDSPTYNTVIGTPIELGMDPGMATRVGDRIYIATVDYADLSPTDPQNAPGTLTVIDIDPDSPTYNSVIDLDPDTAPIDRIDTGKAGTSIVACPDGSLIYTVNPATGLVSVIDVAANEKIAEFSYDTNPAPFLDQTDVFNQVAVGPDGTIYITNGSENAITTATIAST